MTTQQTNDNNPQRQQPTEKNQQQGAQNTSVDERDQQIKNEPDTRRLRSERQSVIDGEQENENG
jgi:hypothetical protein